MSNVYLALNAWREILARVFDGFQCEENASPTWLVNPATRRRLKLDYLYPDAALAVRFVGLTAKGQGRQSDWEVLENDQREETRVELCRRHGVTLCLIDPLEEAPKQLDILIRNLTRAGRLLAQSDRSTQEKSIWQPRISAARQEAESIRQRTVRQPQQTLASLAESWRDRETGTAMVAPAPPPEPVPAAKLDQLLAELAVDCRVVHSKFGEGVVTALEANGENTKITILFDGEQARTFQLDLVHDKLSLA